MITWRLELVIVVATLVAAMYLATTTTTTVLVTVAAAWGLWGVARLNLPEYGKYVLALILLLPALTTIQLVLDGVVYALLAIPALARAAILVSFHRHVLSGVVLIIHDIRGSLGVGHHARSDD